MVLWHGWVGDFYKKAIHYIPKLQDNLQQGMPLSTVIEHECIQAVEIQRTLYHDCKENRLIFIFFNYEQFQQ